MDFLKKLFPLAFGVVPQQSNTLVKSILIHVAISVGWVIISAILGAICGSGIAWFTGLVGYVVGLYTTGGIVLSILRYVKVIKN